MFDVLNNLDRAPFPCNSIIRLQHLNTKKYLHSHAGHASPLSNNQEVSAFDGGDKGDDWILVCLNKSDKFWSRESPIRLREFIPFKCHVDWKSHDFSMYGRA